MSMRPLQLPQDAQMMIEVLPLAFQYPENPAWSVDAEEAQGFTETAQRIQRWWPLIRLLFVLSPRLRDELDGVVWEEDGKPVGVANVGRQGSSDTWYISNVGVLPAYRRRGIARKLTTAAIERAKAGGAHRVTLKVIDGNDPAADLYRKLGFEKFDTGVELSGHQLLMPVCSALPGGYTIKQTANSEWRPQYELAKRITPAVAQRYEPVEETRFRLTWAVRALDALLSRGYRNKRIAVYSEAGDVVAFARYSARLKTGAVNALSIMVDPAHSGLSPYLVRSLVGEILTISPGHTISFRANSWNQALIDAALEIGFAIRRVGNSMGLLLQ